MKKLWYKIRCFLEWYVWKKPDDIARSCIHCNKRQYIGTNTKIDKLKWKNVK